MRVVFLDLDGVIATSGTYKKAKSVKIPQAWGSSTTTWPNPVELLSPELVTNVSKLCLVTGSGVILSTSWRHEYSQEILIGFLLSSGLDPKIQILGKTPSIGHRGKEISASVEHYNLSKSDICILEDEEDVAPFRGRQIQTCFGGNRQGFTERHLTRALRLFDCG